MCHDSEHPDGLIFTSAQGMGLRHEHWNRRVWRPAASKAGLDAGFHSLRHFFASWCINSKADGGLGVSPKVVQSWLGHATIAMTLDTYGHLFPSDGGMAEAPSLLAQ